MVVFTCNNCGDSLQKPKVAKHYQFQCRSTPSLTCVDCLKDFYGDDYVAHTKCMTESERYGGKDYKPKPSANKGERKQQAWINVVQNVLTKSTSLSRDERQFLQTISRHENIPRKKAKFLNFVRNAVGHRANMAVVESCWTKMELAFKEASDTKDTPNGQAEDPPVAEASENNVVENENNENICRENGAESQVNGKKKAKKRELETTDQSDEPTTKKTSQADAPNDETSAETKFRWKSAILEVIGERDEISMKKLRKKVVGRYLHHVGDTTIREKAISRFEKKLNKIPELVVTDDIVKRQ